MRKIAPAIVRHVSEIIQIIALKYKAQNFWKLVVQKNVKVNLTQPNSDGGLYSRLIVVESSVIAWFKVGTLVANLLRTRNTIILAPTCSLAGDFVVLLLQLLNRRQALEIMVTNKR